MYVELFENYNSLNTQMGYISDSNTLKTDWVINSANQFYFDIDHQNTISDSFYI